MNIDWTKLSEHSYAFGYRKMLRREYRMPDGRTAVFDIRHEGPSVSVLALTPDEHVILAKQYRPGPEKVVLDLPCGGIKPDEPPIVAARRELLEETGYDGELHAIGTCLEDGYSTKLRHNFVALNCRQLQEPQCDLDEFIEVTLMPIFEFRVFLRSGELTVVETGYMGLDFLGRL